MEVGIEGVVSDSETSWGRLDRSERGGTIRLMQCFA